MKKYLSIAFSIVLCLSALVSCAKPEPTPLVRSQKADIASEVFSLVQWVVGSDGKLYIGGPNLLSDSSLYSDQSKASLTQKQMTELPQQVKSVLDDNNHILTYNRWQYVADQIVDYHFPGPLYYLTANGNLYVVRDENYDNEVGVPVLVSENVSKICKTWPISFIKDNGDLIIEDTSNRFEDFENAELFRGVSGHKLVKVAENARDANGNVGLKTFAYVDAYGQLWVAGYNDFGQFGNGKYDPVLAQDYEAKKGAGTPISPDGYSNLKFYKVMDDTKQVFLDGGNIFAVKTDNSLWGWGANEFGQAGAGTHGDGDPSTRDVITKPKKILENVVEIQDAASAGAATTEDNTFMALTSDGKLYAWGVTKSGILGDGKFELSNVSSFDIIERGFFADKPTLIQENVKDFTTCSLMGDRVFISLLNNGDLYAWGESAFGTVGSGVRVEYYTNRASEEHFVSAPTKILGDVLSISKYALGAITADGTVWNWGYNPFGWEFKSDYYQDPRRIDNHVLFATPTKNPYISATIAADGTVSFVPTPTE